ncbi:MAG TPA: protein kinase, partial [Gemmata sp.]|nr:protein kinase [Gemmata sp.]
MAASVSGCPSAEDLERLLSEELSDTDLTAVEAHVETCADCQQRLERLVTPTASATRPPSGLTTSDLPGGAANEAFLKRLRQLPLPSAETGSFVADPDREGVPSQLGPYEILKRIGRGGMGTVYRARHLDLDKVVALKVLPADRVDEAAVARFRNEMKAAGQLGHPNIVAAHDAGRIGGTYYLAMDIVDGEDLAALVDELGPLPIADACELIRQAADGLQHACERGFAHRDVKPSNLMLARGGVVKVLDLGLARPLAEMPALERLTAPGVLLGTADYVAPEQIDTAHVADARADVYGLGATLYFLLTGVPPFGGQRSWLDKLRAHKEAQVPSIHKRRPEVPAALASLLERMLAKDPSARPATPGEVAESLRPLTDGADLAGLLARAGGCAVQRPAAPSTRTAIQRGVGGVALRYGLTAAAGAVVALLAAAPFVGPWRERAPEARGDGPAGTPPIQPESTEEPEGARLTYGPNGPPRPDHRVLPGEQVNVEYVVRGIGKDPKGEVNLSVSGELVDHNGKKWTELAPTPIRGLLYHRGSTFTGQISYDLLSQQPPGEYKARGRLMDHISGRSVNFEHPVYVLKPEFGAVRLRLTHDKEKNLPAGSYLTVGQEFFVQMRIVNFEHKDGGIRVSVKVSARDRDDKDTMASPIKPLVIEQKVEDAFTYFDLATGSLRTMMAGEA